MGSKSGKLWNIADHDRCTVWVEKEQIVEAKCAAEAAHAEVEKQKLRCEAAECKQMVAALASRSQVCVRCSLKGLSNVTFYLWLANDRPQGSSV